MKQSILSYTQARNNFSSILDQACDNHESLIITRQGGKNAVIISQEDYDSIIETLYLSNSRKNHKRIVDALKRDGKGQKKYKNIESLKKEFAKK